MKISFWTVYGFQQNCENVKILKSKNQATLMYTKLREFFPWIRFQSYLFFKQKSFIHNITVWLFYNVFFAFNTVNHLFKYINNSNLYTIHYSEHFQANVVWKWFPDFADSSILKRQCHEIFLAFFSLIQPIWFLDKLSKMVLLKNSFSQRYLWKTWLSAVSHCSESGNWDVRKSKIVSHCTESDFAQCDTAQSLQIKIFFCF